MHGTAVIRASNVLKSGMPGRPTCRFSTAVGVAIAAALNKARPATIFFMETIIADVVDETGKVKKLLL
jgi:hypothetical protein